MTVLFRNSSFFNPNTEKEGVIVLAVYLYLLVPPILMYEVSMELFKGLGCIGY